MRTVKYIIKRNGKRVTFDDNKLKHGLHCSFNAQELPETLVDQEAKAF